MKPREQAIKLVHRIIALKAQIAELESELDGILPKNDSNNGDGQRHAPASVPATPPSPDNGTTANLTDRVLELVTANPSATFSAEQVCTRLSLGPEQKHSVRSTLWNLCQKNKIRKIKRGEFGALREENPAA